MSLNYWPAISRADGCQGVHSLARIMPEILPALFALLAEGTITIDTQIYPLSEVTTAWTIPTPSGTRIVLTPDP